MRIPLRSALALAAALGAPGALARPDLVWTGAAGQNVFDLANWDASASAVTSLAPGVPIDDDVVVSGAPLPLSIPALPNQQRFQLGAGRTLTLDASRLVAAEDEGVGGGSGPVTVLVRNGASFEPYFVAGGAHVDVDATSQVVLAGPGNPLNQSTLDLTLGSVARFPGESPGDFIAEHLSKVSVDGAPAVLGQNLLVVDDGSGGSLLQVLMAGTLDQDDDLLSDDDEINLYGTDPTNPDSDGDGCPDGFEVARGLDPLDPASRAERPNVVFVLVDDLGWGDVGVLFQNQVQGTKRHRTPNLDRMAAEGVLLTRHYCPASVCAPSRASLLTGLHQGHANVRNNQFDAALEHGLNLATTLRRAGYATAHIGKFGLQGSGNDPASWPSYPTKIGFDTFYGFVRHGDGHNHYPAHDTAARPRKEVWWDDVEVSGDLDRCFTSDLWTARAKAHIAEHVQTRPETPFFLYLAYDTPHAALQLPPTPYPAGTGLTGGVQWLGTPGAMINAAGGTLDSYVHPDYAGQGWSEGEVRFATLVRRLDDGIGDLLDTLVELGIAEDTLVVLTSDNGPHTESYQPGVGYAANSFDSFGPFDGTKRCTWEGGVRVPTIAWWPGRLPAGRVDDTPAQFHDWLPTLTALAGWTTPARTDGVSLLPLLLGVGERREGTVYVEYESNSSTPNYPEFDPSHRGRQRGQSQMIVLEGYKGIRVGVASHATPFEIFDVVNDPRESVDLRASSPAFIELERRMRDRVLRLRRPLASAPRPYDGEPIPALATAVVRPGLEVRAFEGLWPWTPEFRDLVPAAMSAALEPDAALHVTRDRDAGLLYTGFLAIPSTGDWTFTIESDTAALLRVHDVLAVDEADSLAGFAVPRTLRLAAGLHPIRLYHRTAAGPPALSLRWSGPGVPEAPIPGSAWFRSDASLGVPGCSGRPNTTGMRGALYVEGSAAVSDNDVVLRAEGLPPATFGLCLASLAVGFTANPGGSMGDLCLGGEIGRFTAPGQILTADAAGAFELAIDLGRIPTPTALTPALPSDTWHFQAWYRDFTLQPTSNFTGSRAVTFH